MFRNLGNGCKNSEKISWMIEFLNAETHTPVLLMNRLWSLRLREVRIGVNTVFIRISLETEIARSVRGLKITRAPCRRRTGGAVPRAENFGDLITADHKVLSEGCESQKQSSTCNRGAGLGHQMDPVVSVQNKNFSGNTEKLAKVLGAE